MPRGFGSLQMRSARGLYIATKDMSKDRKTLTFLPLTYLQSNLSIPKLQWLQRSLKRWWPSILKVLFLSSELANQQFPMDLCDLLQTLSLAGGTKLNVSHDLSSWWLLFILLEIAKSERHRGISKASRRPGKRNNVRRSELSGESRKIACLFIRLIHLCSPT